MTLRFLLIAVLAQADPPPDAIARSVQRAVEGDSLAVALGPFQRRLARNPADRTALFALGSAALLTYDYAAVENRFHRVIALGKGPSDRLSAHSRFGLAASYVQRSMLSAAESMLDSARADAHAVKASDLEADILIALANVRLRTTRAEVARSLLDTAAQRIASLQDSPRRRSLAATRKCTAAYVHVRLATPAVRDTALAGAALADTAGEPRVRSACLGMIAQELERQGKFDSALKMMRLEVEPLLRQSRHRHGLATSLQWQGYLAQRIGAYALARRQLTDAVEHAAASGNGSALSWAHIGLAQIAVDMTDNVAAGAHLAQARRLLVAQGDRWGLAIVHGLEADLAHARGSLNEARTAYVETIDSLFAIGNSFATLERYRSLAILEQEARDFDAADRWLRMADSVARNRVAPGWQAERPVHDAANALGRGQLARADSILARVFERTISPPSRFEISSRHAEVLAHRNDLDGVERRLTDAASAFSRWRSWQGDERLFRLALLQSRQVFGVSGAGVPFAISVLARGGRVASAFSYAEQRRARELLTRMAARELPSDTSTSPAHPKSGEAALGTVSLEEVMRSLPERTALVEYMTGRGDEPVTAFVVTRETTRVVSLVLDDTLRSMGRRLGTLLSANAEAGQLATRLGELALGPVLEHIPAGVNRLVIVPDGGMHRVPFEALRLSGGRWLIDRFAIATSPSATAFVRLAGNASAGANAGKALVFGDPVLDRSAAPARNGVQPGSEFHVAFANAGALTRLPWSAREARAVARYFPAADLRVGSRATEAALRTATQQGMSVLHLATHALVDDQVIGRSAIALAPGGGHDGFVSAAELATLSVRADLVVLSGCRTAQGAVFIGEGVQGLTAPLLENGARAVVATRWAIGDREANGMMTRFYDAMARGSPAGDAIRQAQRAAIAEGVPATVWAAFTLVGDPMVKPVLRLP